MVYFYPGEGGRIGVATNATHPFYTALLSTVVDGLHKRTREPACGAVAGSLDVPRAKRVIKPTVRSVNPTQAALPGNVVFGFFYFNDHVYTLVVWRFRYYH